MARPDLGTKRVCPTTGRKFYDLNRDPIVSPYTGEVLQRAATEPLPTRAAPRARPRVEEDQEEQVLEPAGDETISLEDVGAAEEEATAETDDETVASEDAATDDTFLEEEEESGDVSDLIDGDIEDEEEH